jgi:hypothetical protein
MRVRVYLRQSLFSPPASAGDPSHVPAGAAVLDGELLSEGAVGVTVRVSAFADERGRPLQGSPCTLLVPAAKLDHLRVLDGG